MKKLILLSVAVGALLFSCSTPVCSLQLEVATTVSSTLSLPEATWEKTLGLKVSDGCNSYDIAILLGGSVGVFALSNSISLNDFGYFREGDTLIVNLHSGVRYFKIEDGSLYLYDPK